MTDWDVYIIWNTILIALVWRYETVKRFRVRLMKLELNYIRKNLNVWLIGDEKPLELFDKHSFWQMLWSFKPMKLEAWFTDAELDKLNDGLPCE
jgi:hypothetical protein